jgi:PAT family beta-lactamase induction signal transducer AmpG
MALAMGVGIVTVLLIHEPSHELDAETRAREEQVVHALHGNGSLWQRLVSWFGRAVVAPFVEFFARNGVYALWILLLIAIYRISDIAMGIMANPFYLDLGFSKTEIASIIKVFGFFMTIAGAAIGGLMVARFGVFVPLLLGGILAAITNLLFALLAVSEPTLNLLSVVIAADNLSAGLAVTAFLAYLSNLTNTAYTATQYALFSSIMTLLPKTISGFSGIVVESIGYSGFFIYTAVLGLPALVLIVVLMRAHNSGRLQLAGKHEESDG